MSAPATQVLNPDPPTQSAPVRIGCVSYLNTLPLIEGLDKLPQVALVPAVPARLIDLLAAGDVEVALLSLVDSQRTVPAPGGAAEPLALLPVGMIGCDGPTLTVRLFSAVPIDRIQRVHADTDSHTAVALSRVILRRLYNRTPDFVDFDARAALPQGDDPPETLLIIGDKVVSDCPPADRYPHQLDLGEAWKRLAGLPFVYALWACRASLRHNPRILFAAALLDRQRRHNATRSGWIVGARAQEHAWPPDLAAHYLQDLLRYDPGDPDSPARRAVATFLDMAAEDGVLPGRRPTIWADSPPDP